MSTDAEWDDLDQRMETFLQEQIQKVSEPSFTHRAQSKVAQQHIREAIELARPGMEARGLVKTRPDSGS
jgi:hypothetical protein